MNKRVGGIDEFAFDRLSEGRSLHVTIAVTGWLSEDMPGKSVLSDTCSIFPCKPRLLPWSHPRSDPGEAEPCVGLREDE